MGLLSNLFRSGAGIVGNLTRAYNQPAAGWSGYVNVPRYDFPEQVRGLSQAIGLPPPNIRNDRTASFLIPMDGDEYLVVLCLNGQQVRISATSNSTFPRRSVDPQVRLAIHGLNARLQRCTFEVVDCEKESIIGVTCRIDVSLLDPSSFEAALHDLLPAIAAFDSNLRRSGLAYFPY